MGGGAEASGAPRAGGLEATHVTISGETRRGLGCKRYQPGLHLDSTSQGRRAPVIPPGPQDGLRGAA